MSLLGKHSNLISHLKPTSLIGRQLSLSAASCQYGGTWKIRRRFQNLNVVKEMPTFEFVKNGELKKARMLYVCGLGATPSLGLIRYYKLEKKQSEEMSSEQKQFAEMLIDRIRASIQTESITLRDLNLILQHLVVVQGPKSWLSLVEERLLEKFITDDEDDFINKVIRQPDELAYEDICNMLIRLAQNKRRPTPLLKAASRKLCEISVSEKGNRIPKAETIISTLDALINLSYPNRSLISKLVDDLTDTIDLKTLNSTKKCDLLRSIGKLRWRSDRLFKMFYEHIKQHQDDHGLNDHNVIITLLHVSALLNYHHGDDLRSFYADCMQGSREERISKYSRKWLDHVWSLAALEVAEDSHINSVLDDKFVQILKNLSSPTKISFSDAMKLLNLQALADFEFKIESRLSQQNLDELRQYKTLRSVEMCKFASKVREALDSVVGGPAYIRHDVETHLGFNIDSEVCLDEESGFVSMKELETFNDIILAFRKGTPMNNAPKLRRCAIIYVSYDGLIANSSGQVVGHKQMISRILKAINYETIFLPEPIINREKTSTDLINSVKRIIESPDSGNL